MKMMKIMLLGTILIGLTACADAGKKATGRSKSRDEQTILFTIRQERDIYEQSDYGEPPQFAIWLENKETGAIRTVFVTYRTATGDFEGKVECSVSLPAWIGAFRKETGRRDFPTPWDPATDAVTGATPKRKEFKARVNIPSDSKWYYYVEVNVSGDYTPEFPSVQQDGVIDAQCNGQPSLIYKGEIAGVSGAQSTPELIGRTEQLYFSSEINPDLIGIDNAKKLFSQIKAVCLK